MRGKKYFVAGCLCVLVLLLFAVYFNVSRLYGDSAFYLFKIVNHEKFVIEHNRPIAAVIEILPYFLTRISASMSAIILSFSLNEWLYFAVSFFVISLLLKNPTAGFAMLFAYIAGSRWNYFNPVSELILSTPLYFILYSLLDRKPGKIIMAFISLLIVLLVFNHPLNSIIVPALLILYWLGRTPENKKPFIFMLAILIMTIIAHYFVLDNYERNPMQQHDKDYSPISYLLKFNYARFWSKTIPWYLGTLVLFSFSFFYLFKQRKYRLLASSFLFAAIYFSLVMYSSSFLYPNTYEPFERYLFLLPVFSSVLFFLSCKQENVFVRYIVPVVLIIYHLGLNFIYGQFVKGRYAYFEKIISYAQQFPEQKMAIRNSNYYYIKPRGHDWEMPNESLLLSSRQGRENVRQVFIREAFSGEMLSNLQEDQFFYSPSLPGQMNTTSQKYFPLTPCKIRYANTDSDQSNLPEAFFKNISIECDVPKKLHPGKEISIPVTLRNKNREPLTSGMNTVKVAISYLWYKDGNPMPWDSIQSPILVDVYSEVNQEMILRMPKEKGTYELRIDIIFKESKWAGVSSERLILK